VGVQQEPAVGASASLVELDAVLEHGEQQRERR
jgi:hypothetical protein